MTDPTIISITSSFDPRLALLVGWVVLLTKTAVDWLKTAVVLPPWAPPALAFLFAWALMVLLMLAMGVPLTGQLVAQATICALVATVLAVGQTALQSRTRPTEVTVAAIADELETRAAERQVAAASDPLISKPPSWLPPERG